MLSGVENVFPLLGRFQKEKNFLSIYRCEYVELNILKHNFVEDANGHTQHS